MQFIYDWAKAFKASEGGNRKLLDKHISSFYSEKLFPYIKGRTYSDSISHEVSNAVITKFWEKFYIEKAELPKNVSNYIYAMANNAITYYYRVKTKRMKTIAHLDETKAMHMLQDYKEDIDYGKDDGELRLLKGLAYGFKNLGERCKALLSLVIIEKKKIRQIYEDMGFPTENAASQKKLSCLKKLKKLVYQKIK